MAGGCPSLLSGGGEHLWQMQQAWQKEPSGIPSGNPSPIAGCLQSVARARCLPFLLPAYRSTTEVPAVIDVRRETAELAIDRYVRSGHVVGLGSGLIVRLAPRLLITGLLTRS